jgi:hypothetical protein
VSENTRISNFVKIRVLEAELVRADGGTDRRTEIAKLIVAFHDFSNAPKNCDTFLKTY